MKVVGERWILRREWSFWADPTLDAAMRGVGVLIVGADDSRLFFLEQDGRIESMRHADLHAFERAR